ncbi:MAG: TIGR00730 family Rossman fold protein [Alphaproteobacteria bacterium]|nr:TIGR00730 family Rossman fold protein [Alphaproteobacteria bacterium]MDE2161820.1 TIGR00730 family Rossman fold protein [Alphaproteobacteria bacterium]MDE2501047.1 TIGR00730 family Rossman fold protein [Alphaproteobacteria bacterium]
MEKNKPVICVFCGSSHGAKPQYAVAARTLGRLIAERGFSLVFGGGGLGLMGETARAVRDGGAPVTGIMPQFLSWIEQPPEWEKELIITPDLQLRKTRMLEMSDAFVLLPGGAGTMDEFFEVVTSASLGVLPKPVVVVNIDGYFAPLEALMKHIVAEGFAKPAIRSFYKLVETPEAAMDAITESLGALARD